MRTILLMALALLAACAAPGGRNVVATPASPQPDDAALRPGLAVAYAYPVDVRSLGEARRLRAVAQPGPPLPGLDFRDTKRGENALTSRQPERVVAFIDGYLRVDRPGTHELRFWSNDGLEVSIGGALVYRHDGRHTCQTQGGRSFTAPEAGWYRFEAVYFQRLNTSCLLMNWPASSFAHEAG